MPHLTRDQILKSSDLKYEDIEIPEWGGVVRVRELRAYEREMFEKRMMGTGGNADKIAKELGDLRATLVVKCLIDPVTEERLFQDSDIKALNEKAATVLMKLFGVCSRISGISQEAVETITGESEVIVEGGSS